MQAKILALSTSIPNFIPNDFSSSIIFEGWHAVSPRKQKWPTILQSTEHSKEEINHEQQRCGV
jgi:hypothetical protein